MKEYCKLYKENRTLIIAIMRLWETEELGENLEIRIECEEDMDTYAEFTLPAYHCHHAYGFKETELIEIKNFLKDNAVTIWRMARGELYNRDCRSLGQRYLLLDVADRNRNTKIEKSGILEGR